MDWNCHARGEARMRFLFTLEWLTYFPLYSFICCANSPLVDSYFRLDTVNCERCLKFRVCQVTVVWNNEQRGFVNTGFIYKRYDRLTRQHEGCQQSFVCSHLLSKRSFNTTLNIKKATRDRKDFLRECSFFDNSS